MCANVVQCAWDEGNHNRHGGAGFYLIVKLPDGTTYRGPAYPPKKGIIRIDNVIKDTDGEVDPVFVRMDAAIAAQVEW